MTVASLATIDALAAGDPADPGDDPGAGGLVVVEAVGGERRELEERRAGVEQAVDALARQQLAAADVALGGAFAATRRTLCSCALRSATSAVSASGWRRTPRIRGWRGCAGRSRVRPSTRASGWSTATLSPTATVSSATSPSTGAVSTSSIFIDSSTTSRSPALTRSPAAACTSSTCPGIGARSAPSAAASPSPSAGRRRALPRPSRRARSTSRRRRGPASHSPRRRSRSGRRRAGSPSPRTRAATTTSTRIAAAHREAPVRRGARAAQPPAVDAIERIGAGARGAVGEDEHGGGDRDTLVADGLRRDVAAIDQPGVELAGADRVVGEQAAQVRVVVVTPRTVKPASARSRPGERLLAVRAVGDDLGEQRVVAGVRRRFPVRWRRRRAPVRGSARA